MALVVLGCAVASWFPVRLQRAEEWIFLTGLAVGLPHGAVDHLLPFWQGWFRRRRVTLALTLLGYLAVALVSLVLLRAGGASALVILLVLSVLHFGLGDVMAETRPAQVVGPFGPRSSRGSRRVHRRLGPALLLTATVIARGAPVLLGPLIRWPDQTQLLLQAIAPGIALPSVTLRWVFAAGYLVCVAVSVVSAVRRGGWRWVAETALVATLFLLAPPLAAFGIYFGGWHGLRHTARMISEQPENHVDLAAGRIAAPIRRFLVGAAGPTLVAAIGIVGLVWLAHASAGLSGPAFSALFALTVPHLVMVAVLDVRTRQPAISAR